MMGLTGEIHCGIIYRIFFEVIMANTSKDVQEQLRQWVRRAISQGVHTPVGVKEYLIDNGWEHPLPWRMTIEKLLKENGIVFVRGYWTPSK